MANESNGSEEGSGVPAIAILAPQERSGKRIEFLDFIRGIAAVAVAIGHIAEQYFSSAEVFLVREFSLGIFGVTAFFILSGFVIPFTIERYDSLKLFWINRFFRLYPLYWASLIVATVVVTSPYHPYRSPYEEGLEKWLPLNATMFQGVLNRPSAVELYWTLGYELLFYGLMSILFLRKSMRTSIVPVAMFSLGVLAMGVAGPLRSGDSDFAFRLFWIGTFFFGTWTYRAWSKQIQPRTYWVGALLFLGAVAATGYYNFVVHTLEAAKGEVGGIAALRSWAAAFGFFLTLTFFQPQSVHPIFLWLGRISYSVYIVHGVLVLVRWTGDPWVVSASLLAATLMISTATYQWIEAPFQTKGKRIIDRIRGSRSVRSESSA